MRLENANMMLQLGYEAIKEKGKEIKFKYKKMEQQPGMPGAPGMEQPMPGMEGMSPGAEGQPAGVDQLPTPPPIGGPEMSEAGVPIPAEE